MMNMAHEFSAAGPEGEARSKRKDAMKMIRILTAGAVASVFSVLYNGLVHMVILGPANQQLETLKRGDFSSKVWISLAGTLAVCFLFTGIYALFSGKKDLGTGMRFGFLFGLAAAVLVDLNQYVLYPLPFSLVVHWSFFGVVEFTVLGAIVGSIVRGKA